LLYLTPQIPGSDSEIEAEDAQDEAVADIHDADQRLMRVLKKNKLSRSCWPKIQRSVGFVETLLKATSLEKGEP
jgi:hypothetical protein